MSDNPRLPNNLNIDSLAENIISVGKLLEPITVWSPDGSKSLEVIRGHRRTMAIQKISMDYPEKYAELFPSGIPAFVVEGCTPDEVIELKLDHTEQQGLTDPHEVQMSANMLFKIRKTEAEVANILSSLIDKIAPMKPKAKAELADLRDILEDAKASKKAKAIDTAQKAVEKFIADYRRGFVQNLHNAYRCPHIVMAAMYAKASGGIHPKGFEDAYLPKLTNNQVTSLWKAHKEDLEIKDEQTGGPKYNQVRTGPHFNEKWEKLVKADQDESEGEAKEPKPKAMSAKDMMADITEGRFSSVGFVKLTAYHTGDKSVEGLEEIDTDYHYLDLVKVHANDLYEMVVSEARKVQDELIAKDKEANK